MNIRNDNSSNKILQKLRKEISALKIQSTWRSYLIMKNAREERELAKYNKILNHVYVHQNNCKNDECVKKNHKKVFISEFQDVMDTDNTVSTEQVCYSDGKDKETSIFTYMVNSWLCFFGENETFFNNHVKEWVNTDSSLNWGDYIEQLIQILNDGEIATLWGKQGGYKKITPSEKKYIINLQNQWNLYKEENEKAVPQKKSGLHLKKVRYEADIIYSPYINKFDTFDV